MACDVNIGICADGSQAQQELKKTKGATKVFTEQAKAMFKQMLTAASIVGAAYMAFKNLKQLFIDSVKEYAEYQAKVTDLNSVVNSAGYAAGFTTDQLVKLSEELKRGTVYTDDMVVEAETLLGTFNKVSGDVFPETIKVAMNMSTILKTDLTQSIKMLGKALQDPVLGMTALRKAQVVFTAEQKEMVKGLVESGRSLQAQKYILEVVSGQYGDAAAAAGKTFAGGILRAKNNINDLKKALGAILVEEGGMGSFVQKMNEWLEMDSNIKAITAILRGMFLMLSVGLGLTIANFKAIIIAQFAVIDGFRDVANLAAIVFDPKNWFTPGKMKEALAGFRSKLIVDFVAIGKEYIGVGERARDQFLKLISLEGVKIDYGAAKGGVAGLAETEETLTEKTKKQTEALNQRAVAMGLALQQGNLYTTIYSQGAMEGVEFADSVARIKTEIAGMPAVMAASDAAILTHEAKVASLRDTYKDTQWTLTDWKNYMETTFVSSMQSSWEMIWSTAGDTAKKIKQAVKDIISTMLQGIGKHLMASAVEWLLMFPPRPGKFALAMAGAAAAFAAAAAVRAMQAGGVVARQGGGSINGYGGGDKVPVMAEEGEMFMRKEVVRRNRAVLNGYNTGQGGNVIIPISIGTRHIYTEIKRGFENRGIKVRSRDIITATS